MSLLLVFLCALSLTVADLQTIRFKSQVKPPLYDDINLNIDGPFDVEAETPIPNFRIVNGIEAKPNAYPFLVRLLVYWGNSGGLCGATILNKNFVVTAAHCFYHPDTGAFADGVQVTMGDHRKSVREASEVSLMGSYIHLNGYNKATHYNDIAIIEFSQDISFTPQIQPACIVASGSDYTGQMATAAGWGTIGSGKPTSDVLLQVNLPVLPDSTCRNSYYSGFKSDAMLCGGYTDGTKDTCQGDSGGPLFFKQNNKFTVVGLTSFGYGCASAGYPGVYTRVAAFNSWIKQTAGSVCVN